MEQTRDNGTQGIVYPVFAEIARRRQHIRTVLQGLNKHNINN